jgi:hypothetical protein
MSMALAGTSLVLPASPQDAAVGDVDGDGRSEIALLVEWPEWSSIAEEQRLGPGRSEMTVVPAIEVRRELWVLRVAGARLERLAPPLAVGPDVVALDAPEGGGPVVALTREGPARLESVTGEMSGDRVATLALEHIASVDTPLGRSESVLPRLRLVADLEGDAGWSVVVPTSTGTAFVDPNGGVTELPAAFRDVRSGPEARLSMSLPQLVDLDGDGSHELLESRTGERGRIKWTPRRADGGYGEPVVWDTGSLHRRALPRREATPDGEGSRTVLVLWDTGDMDGDGTLEVAVGTRRMEDPGLGEALDAIRGKAAIDLAFHTLNWDGTVSEEAERRLEMRGHPMYVRNAAGGPSPFVDLDRDGLPELLTVRIRIGVFGVARTVASGEASPKVEISGYRLLGGKWKRASSNMPEVRYRVDLGSGELSQYARVPGDVTGDGAWDLVEIDGQTVRVYPGNAGSGPFFSDEPANERSLQAPIRSWQGAMFVDLEGNGRLDLIAFEPVDAEEQEGMVDPVRIELVRLDDREEP